jgi:hypothetical protein
MISPLNSSSIAQTCGELAKFYEHAAEESFCIQIMPLLREYCCKEVVTSEIAPVHEPNSAVTSQHKVDSKSSAMSRYDEWSLVTFVVAVLCLAFRI